MRTYKLTINESRYEVIVKEVTSDRAKVEVNGVEQIVFIDEIKNISLPSMHLSPNECKAPPISSHHGESSTVDNSKTKKTNVENGLKAPIPGQVKTVFVKEGDRINVGEKVLVLEAMKLENEIASHSSGVVKKVLVSAGDSVNQDQVMVEIGE